MNSLVLIGFKSSGKSTLGRALGASLGRNYLDTDTLLEQRYAAQTGEKLSCREIYAACGEEGFRLQEGAVLKELASSAQPVIIATGGGVILRPEHIPLLKQCGHVVFLDTTLELIAARLHKVDSPLFQQQGWQTLYSQRRPLYEAAADTCFRITGEQAPETLAAELLQQLNEQHHVI